MKKMLGLIILCFVTTLSFSEPNEVWKPSASFQLENSNLQQTMFFISGMAYGLNEYNKQLKKNNKPLLFCLSGTGVIQSPLLFEILNTQYSGEKITAVQAAAAILSGLQDRFPCK